MKNQFLRDRQWSYSDCLPFFKKYRLSVREDEWASNINKKVIVGLSGGVDSSVSALILLMQNYNVESIFMKNWDDPDDSECTAEEDFVYAKKVAAALSMNIYSINLAEEYKNEVFDYFLQKIREGETPNPDILCNREVKFKKFFDLCLSYGADFMATGHYSQLVNAREGRLDLAKGIDSNKDQTYFLAEIDSKVFPKVLFPIGALHKPEVREIAQNFKLASANKKDSTGICFIGERNFKKFLSQYINKTKGNFINEQGAILGKHDGVGFYTIGQRKGLGIGGPGGPFFVSHKNSETNEITLVEGEENPLLYSQGVFLKEINFFHDDYKEIQNCAVKIRYRQKEVPCKVLKLNEGYYIKFDKPVRAATKMQFAVLYQENLCLGGGEIQEVHNYYTEEKFSFIS